MEFIDFWLKNGLPPWGGFCSLPTRVLLLFLLELALEFADANGELMALAATDWPLPPIMKPTCTGGCAEDICLNKPGCCKLGCCKPGYSEAGTSVAALTMGGFCSGAEVSI